MDQCNVWIQAVNHSTREERNVKAPEQEEVPEELTQAEKKKSY